MFYVFSDRIWSLMQFTIKIVFFYLGKSFIITWMTILLRLNSSVGFFPKCLDPNNYIYVFFCPLISWFLDLFWRKRSARLRNTWQIEYLQRLEDVRKALGKFTIVFWTWRNFLKSFFLCSRWRLWSSICSFIVYYKRCVLPSFCWHF